MKNLRSLTLFLMVALATGNIFASDYGISGILEQITTAITTQTTAVIAPLENFIKENPIPSVAVTAFATLAIIAFIKCPMQQYTREEIEAHEESQEEAREESQEKVCEEAFTTYTTNCSSKDNKKTEKCKNMATAMIEKCTKVGEDDRSEQCNATIAMILQDAKDAKEAIMNGQKQKQD